MTEAGPVLAALLGLPLLELRLDCSPHTALAQLRGEPPGETKAGWRPLGLIRVCLWSRGKLGEALGAWRQPTLAMITGPQLDTGLPAAATALLAQWNVPLLGLIQWGEWDPRPGAATALPGWGPWPWTEGGWIRRKAAERTPCVWPSANAGGRSGPAEVFRVPSRARPGPLWAVGACLHDRR